MADFVYLIHPLRDTYFDKPTAREEQEHLATLEIRGPLVQPGQLVGLALLVRLGPPDKRAPQEPLAVRARLA